MRVKTTSSDQTPEPLQAKTSMNKGYLTLAFGKERFLQMAVNLARSLQYVSPDLPRAIITDQPDHPDLIKWFHNRISIDPQKGSDNQQKAYLFEYTPFDETMVIDSDCLALRELEPLWEKLSVQDFSVLGTNLTEGQWRYNIAEIRKKLNLTTIPKFNGGCYYFRKSNLAQEVAYRFQELAENYPETLKLTNNKHDVGVKVSEELCLSIALAEKGIPAIEAYEKREMIGPLQLEAGCVKMEILRKTFRCIHADIVYESYIGHFFWNFHEGFHYKREVTKLKLALEKGWNAIMTRILVNTLWNPPYFIFTFLYGALQRLTGRKPIRIMACARPDSFFGELKSKIKSGS